MKCIVILSSVVISVMQRHVNYARIHNNTVSCRGVIPETTVRNIRKSCNVHGSPYKILRPPSQPRFFAWLRRKVQSQAHRSNGESVRERERKRERDRECIELEDLARKGWTKSLVDRTAMVGQVDGGWARSRGTWKPDVRLRDAENGERTRAYVRACIRACAHVLERRNVEENVETTNGRT